MRRLFLMFIGALMLVAGVALLWTAQGPQDQQERTTGGVLYSQQEVAAEMVQGSADLGVTTDAGATTINEQPVPIAIAPNFQGAASAQGEAPLTTAQVDIAPQQASVPLTTDIVLNQETGVEVAPLQTGAGEAGITPDGQGGMATVGTGYEQRVVELEWPSKFQVGRGGAVRIKLKVLEGGALQPVAEVAGNEVIATPILLTDRYDTHNAFITATISAPDFEMDAVSPARQPLQRGGEVEWRWTLTADSAQTSVISLGLMISWDAKPGQTPGPQNVALWGQALQVEVNYVFGLITVPQASVAGTALAIWGFAAQIPLADKILETLWEVFFGRRKRREEQRRRSQSNDRRSRRY